MAETSHTNILIVYIYIETDSAEGLRKRESFWQHELNTFQSNGLNECGIVLTKIMHISHLFAY